MDYGFIGQLPPLYLRISAKHIWPKYMGGGLEGPYINICPVVKPQDTMVQWTAEERAAIEAVFAKLDYESVGRESLTR